MYREAEGLFLAKDRTSPEASAAAFGIGRIDRHLFVCLGPDCTDPEQGLATWEYVKQRLKELNLTWPSTPIEHLIGGRIVSDLSFARNPLYMRDAEIS